MLAKINESRALVGHLEFCPLYVASQIAAPFGIFLNGNFNDGRHLIAVNLGKINKGVAPIVDGHVINEICKTDLR